MPRPSRILLAVLWGVLAAGATVSCSRDSQTDEEGRVILAFESWKSAILDHQTGRAMTYIPGHVNDYLNTLNSATVSSAVPEAAPTSSPGVDLLLRTALEKKVPADLRSSLTLNLLMQRITDRRLFNPRSLREIDLGHVSINGNHASAELYYQGMLTALRLPFVKEGDTWKIDVMAILPYAEVLMRVDRAIKGQTEAQQVEQLVDKLPSL